MPEAFYKVVFCPEPLKAIGFIYKNKSGNRPLDAYVNSVDEVERITGIDFFPSLPDSVEEAVGSCLRPRRVADAGTLTVQVRGLSFLRRCSRNRTKAVEQEQCPEHAKETYAGDGTVYSQRSKRNGAERIQQAIVRSLCSREMRHSRFRFFREDKK